MRNVRLKCTAAAGAVALATLAFVGSTSAAAGTEPATGSPLVFGAVNTISGPAGSPQEVQAFQAYIDNWNAHGGYKGHPIKVLNEDGGLDPTMTSAAARNLVTSDNVIGLVNNEAFLDCSVNNSFYVANQIAVLSAGQNSSSCYDPTVDFPTLKKGGSGGQSILIKYAISQGAKNIALVAPSVQGVQTVIAASLAYAKTTHANVIVPTALPLIPTAADIDELLVGLKAKNVDTVIVLGAAATGELMLSEAQKQSFGVQNRIRYMFVDSEYSPSLAGPFNGTYVIIDGYPWNDPAAKQALAVVKKAKVSVLDGSALGGYQIAGEFKQVLDSVKGPVTRASFLAAARHATSISVPLTPGYKVNLADPSKDLEGGFVVKAKDGGFVLAAPFLTTK